MRSKAPSLGNIEEMWCIGYIVVRLFKIAKFHGKLSISRKTVHFTFRVTAVKSRNRFVLALG